MTLLTANTARLSPKWNGFNPLLLGGIHSPRQLANLAAWYDIQDASSLVYDGSNRVQLIADKSGNSLVNCLCLNGASGNYASTPITAALRVASDIDLRIDVSLVSWATGAQQRLIDGDNGSPNRSYSFEVAASGALVLSLSQDGTTFSSGTSNVTTGFSAFARRGLRVTWRASDGKVQFFTRSDTDITSNTGWTQLGADQAIALASIFGATGSVGIGARPTNSLLATGRIYRAQIYNGIGGTLAFDANFATASKLATSFTESSSNAATVTINTSGDLGARICGERDLVQMTASKQPVYLPWSGRNYGYLNAVTGNFFSTPDSAAVSITGDIDIRVLLAGRDYAPAAGYTVIQKWSANGAVVQRSWLLEITPTGSLRFVWAPAGSYSASFDKTSTAATGFANGTEHWVRVTMDVDNGAGGYDLKFWTSDDGVTWVQLGSTVTAAGTTGFFDGNTPVYIGQSEDATFPRPIPANIYRAQIYNGIAGTLAADFDPSRYTSGSTFAASTGETWTLNGGATIVTHTCLYGDGSNDYMKSAPFSHAQSLTHYFVGSMIAWSGGRYLSDGGSATTSSGYLVMAGTTPKLRYNSTGDTVFTTGLAVSTRGIIMTSAFSTSASVRVNRNSVTTAAPSATPITPNGVTLFADGNGANPANATLSELTIFAAAHDTPTQDRLILYLGRHNRIAV